MNREKAIAITLSIFCYACGQVDENGEREKERYYQVYSSIDTSLQKVITYHSNGQPETIYQVINGKTHGKYTKYDSSGIIKIRANYNKGLLDDEFILYSMEGKPKEIRNYTAGKIDGWTQAFNTKGDVVAKNYFYMDSLVYKELYDTNQSYSLYYKSYSPIIHIDRPSLLITDTLELSAKLPLPSSFFIGSEYIFKYDIVPDSVFSKKPIPYPIFSFNIDSNLVVEKYVFDNPGKYIFYGAVTEKDDTSNHLKSLFKKEIFVREI